MLVYRLIKERYADDPLNAEGAKRFGGRWNSKGQSVLYAADSLALAALEILAHTQITQALNAYVCVKIQLSDDAILMLDDQDLPDDWQADPPAYSTLFIGDDWLQQRSSLALSVPSTLITIQRNFLINPEHDGFEEVYQALEVEDFVFDKRFYP